MTVADEVSKGAEIDLAGAPAPGPSTPLSAAQADAANHANRWPITICIMAATTMVVLDQTIASVALPHIQGSVSASQDQITWVLTSYIVASALALPLAGWLAARVGTRTLLLTSVAMFTLSSALCGLAQNLPEIVLFRILQGASGAPLMPLSQSVIYGVHPPQGRTQAMALWGMGNMAAPMLGPLVGGWLTENWSWHWVFFVNIPIGIACFFALSTFLVQGGDRERRPFDGAGYGLLVCFIGGLQLMLDRGQGIGWFDAPEIWTELIIAALGIYLFLLHAMTAKNPFFHPSIMSNTSLLTTALLGSIITAAMMSATALQPLMVQRLLGYSVLQAGMIAAPRGIGLLIGMQAANLLISRVGARTLMCVGMLASGVSLLMMSQFSLQMDAVPLVITGLIGGLGGPLVFMPVSLMALGSVEPELRTEGATMFNLFRNLGSSLGIAVVSALQVRGAQEARMQLLQHLRPDNPLIGAYMPGAFQSSSSLAGLNALAAQQAEMMSYIGVFGLLGLVSIACIPLILLMKPPVAPVSSSETEAIID